MYCDFYNLSEKPFNVTPDPKFLYLNARYREALATLNYGITERKGFVTLIGEAGTGKTTLLNKLLDQLEPSTKTVFLFNTNVTFEDILEYIFNEFDLPVHSGKKLYMLQRLNAFLLDELRGGGNVALLIDEAQDLDISVLEDLRLLSNLETAKEKILQIVLSGQPELGQKLANPSLRQLRQRIAINCRLHPLTREEVSEYIQFRLQAAGCSEPKMFTREAEEEVWRYSQGIPRLVNVVCDNALVIGYALGKRRIDAEVAKEASADLLTAEEDAFSSNFDDVADETGLATEVGPSGALPSRKGTWIVFAVVALALLVGFISMGGRLFGEGERTASVPASPELAARDVIRPGEMPDRHSPIGVYRGDAKKLSDTGTRRAVPREIEPPRDAVAAPAVVAATERGGPRAAAAQQPALAELKPKAVVAPQTDARAAKESDRAGAPSSEVQARPAEPRSGDAVGDVAAVPPAEAVEEVAEPARPPAENGGEAAQIAAAEVTEPAMAMGKAADSVAPPADDGDEGAPIAAAEVTEPPAAPADVAPTAAEPAPEVRRAAVEKSAAVEPPAAPVAEVAAVSRDPFRLSTEQVERVVAEAGDSVGALAVRKYGRASYTILDLLKLANPDLRDVDRIATGQVIALPELTGSFSVLTDAQDRYRILIHSTPAAQRAKSLAAGLRALGFEAQVLRARIGEHKTVNRVLVGPVESREEAERISERIRRAFREDESLGRLGRY